ncbi:MAG: hypothetical protein ACLU6O_05530 [Bilophila wadsworthia]
MFVSAEPEDAAPSGHSDGWIVRGRSAGSIRHCAACKAILVLSCDLPFMDG